MQSEEIFAPRLMHHPVRRAIVAPSLARFRCRTRPGAQQVWIPGTEALLMSYHLQGLQRAQFFCCALTAIPKYFAFSCIFLKFHENILIPYRRRNSLRLKAYDYSQPGDYFITICTKGRQCLFGEIEHGAIQLSPIGRLVNDCWSEIPEHFPRVELDAFQIMPNHLHGILKIIRSTETAQVLHQQPDTGLNQFQHVAPNSLSSIIRSFKAAVTRKVHQKKLFAGMSPWHRNFYDHIIRNDVDHFFIARYIHLNPLCWYFDCENPSVLLDSIVAFRSMLKDKKWFTDDELDYLMEYELEYRDYRKSS